MNSEQVVRSYYSRIKGLPDTKYIAAGTIVESVLVIIRGLAVGIDYIVSPFIYLAFGLLSYVKLKKFSLFIFNLTAIFYLLFSFTPIQPIFAFGVFIPLAGYGLISQLKEELVDFVLAAQAILPSLIYGLLPVYYIYIAAVILGFHGYIHLVNRKGVKLVGIRSLDVVKPFLAGFLQKEYRLVDDLMTLLSVKHDVIVPMFKLGDEIFVLPKLHYGIFGGAGSSRFVYDVEAECPNCTVFHGPGSHELDAASSSESKRIAKAVSQFIKEGDWKPLKFYGISYWAEGNMEGYSLIFDRVSLTFLRRPGKGIDDLPQELWNYSYGTGNFIVDTHSETLKDEITREDVNAIKRGLSKLSKSYERPLLFAKKEGFLESGCEGLCSNKVKVFALSDGTRRIGIVYIYANNSSEELGKALKGVQGYNDVILVTPDDHSCTGISIGELYSPASNCDTLVKMAKELLSEAIKDLRPVDAKFAMVNVRDVRLVGPVISNLLQSLSVVGEFVRKTYWIPFLLPFIAILVIMLFRSLLPVH